MAEGENGGPGWLTQKQMAVMSEWGIKMADCPNGGSILLRLLSVVGVATVSVQWRGRAATTDLYVIEENVVSLLGRPTIEDLNMLRWDLDDSIAAAVHEAEDTNKCSKLEDEFP